MVWCPGVSRHDSGGKYPTWALLIPFVALFGACTNDSTQPSASTTTTATTTATTTSSTTTSVAPTFTLFGFVLDRSSRPVVGARVAVVDGVNAGKSSNADGNGYYSIPGILAASFTLRTTLNGVFLLDVGITVTQDTRRDLPVTTTSTTTTSTTTTSVGGGGGGGPARVDFRTNSSTCRCTVGIITVRVDGANSGTMGCTGSVSVGVSAAAHTFNACDNVSCFGEARATLKAGDVFVYTATCSGGFRSEKEVR